MLYQAATQHCRCRKSYRVLEDEIGMHDCPYCGSSPSGPAEDVADLTANVALWLRSDDDLLDLVRESRDYAALVDQLESVGVFETPDGVSYDDPALDRAELDRVIAELKRDA